MMTTKMDHVVRYRGVESNILFSQSFALCKQRLVFKSPDCIIRAVNKIQHDEHRPTVAIALDSLCIRIWSVSYIYQWWIHLVIPFYPAPFPNSW